MKRILYNHPEAQFVFCAGDDKVDHTRLSSATIKTDPLSRSQTDEDMFRSLLFPSDAASMQPPVSAAILDPDSASEMKPVKLRITPQDVFSTTVGASNKKTLARWHVTSPGEIVDAMLSLV